MLLKFREMPMHELGRGMLCLTVSGEGGGGVNIHRKIITFIRIWAFKLLYMAGKPLKYWMKVV